ncbi:hypothetical protein [Pseudoxanthomonas sp. JBR18]|uniref:hypothetical protein n=1 Tax=Pseudoxanthomonas sp. JBR18 TaxID=2969308 RepID=UPI002306D42A|nr:hypothetical protein [Pseudoxanthomonas sp. JBR18]WCE04441.1 hypothetical protein PJ250_00055 [Pseudoxanthomonas sp. JBR18]
MTPRRREPSKPWWHAHIGLIWSLALVAGGGFLAVKVQLAQQQTAIDRATPSRNREIDSLERRIAALENRRCDQ